jgi:uncharacterized membrane protein
MLQFLGHLHPVLVHLPIGILLLGCLFLWQSRKDRFAHLQPAINIILLLGMISAILACITGFILSQTGDYDQEAVDLHQWMGISVTVASAITYFFHKKISLQKWQLPMGFLLLMLIFITGHLGGSLTHGSDYLTQPLMDIFNGDSAKPIKRKPIPNVQEAFVYGDIIAPILEEKCYGCHGKNKQKGKLRLDDSASLIKGGKDGLILLPNNSAKSELIKRILLPVEDEHHMAPKEKTQLTEGEIAVLKWWIDNGLTFSKKAGQFPQPEKIKIALSALQSPLETINHDLDLPQVPVEKGDEASIQKLKDLGVVVIPVAQNNNYLSVDFVSLTNPTDQAISLLSPLKNQIVWLNLNNTSVGDSVLSGLGNFTNLTKLQLANTNISDSGLASLKNLGSLRSLNLVGTKITVAGLKMLIGLKNLKSLYLFETKIKKTEWTEIKNLFPKTSVDSGGYQVPLLHDDTVIVKPPSLKN